MQDRLTAAAFAPRPATKASSHTTPAVSAPPVTTAQGAIISLPVDLLFVGGLSILHFLVLLTFGARIETPTLYAFAALATPLTWGINHPHFSATSYRLYRSKSDMQQFPVTAYVLPICMLFLTVAALLSPTEFGPWFIKIYLIWSPYHFSAQTLGVALLYARRSGFEISPVLRKILSFFIFSTFLGPSLWAEQGQTGSNYYGIVTPSFHLPAWVWPSFQIIIWGLGAALLVAFIVSARRQNRKIPPLLVMALPLTQYIWFVAGASMTGFTAFVPAYHSLQYLLIAWLLEMRTRQIESSTHSSPLILVARTTKWSLANVIGGVVLFAVLPWSMARATGADPFIATGITLAAVQMHHFIVDGVVWKLKNPSVGSPLMTSLDTLTGRPAHA